MGARAMSVAAVASAGLLGLTGSPSAASGEWLPAEQVPGTAYLNTGADATVSSVSCPLASDCVAGGSYTVKGIAQEPPTTHAYVVTERNGNWGNAAQVAGPGVFNDGYAYLESLSCATPGDCAAGGSFTSQPAVGTAPATDEAWVAAERNGTWERAIAVPGISMLNQGGYATVTSVSCSAPGDCAVGGAYDLSALLHPNEHGSAAFVVSERNGSWGRATMVPGMKRLNQGRAGAVTSVSCFSPGDCAAGGYYTAGSNVPYAFTVTERNGTWDTATVVPGGGTRGSEITTVSCAPAGGCAAGGIFADHAGHYQASVTTEVHGRWGKAEQVPGTAGRAALVVSVSCPAAGACAAGGAYTDSSKHVQAFVLSEVAGRWRSAEEVPGTAALNQGGEAEILAVSCAAPGSCSAGGVYSGGGTQAFVVNEVR